jgi:hypothetical protein
MKRTRGVFGWRGTLAAVFAVAAVIASVVPRSLVVRFIPYPTYELWRFGALAAVLILVVTVGLLLESLATKRGHVSSKEPLKVHRVVGMLLVHLSIIHEPVDPTGIHQFPPSSGH